MAATATRDSRRARRRGDAQSYEATSIAKADERRPIQASSTTWHPASEDDEPVVPSFVGALSPTPIVS
eukprot:4285952-Pleurochrysis_carterae.AAC.1